MFIYQLRLFFCRIDSIVDEMCKTDSEDNDRYALLV